MKRPTRRSLVLIGVGGLLVVAGSTAQAGWLFVLAAGVIGTVGASLFVGHGISRLHLERELPPATTVGENVNVRLTVKNLGKRSTGLVRVTDRFEGLEDTALLIESAKPGETLIAGTHRTAARRGVWSGGEVTLETGPPFGFFVSKRRLQVGSSLVVRPKTVTLEHFPLVASSSAPSSDLRDRPRSGMGDEFLGVRQYRAGDPMRSIHWRSTARTGQLVVREFEETAQERCRILLGGPDFGEGPDSAFETVVSAAGSVALYAIEHRHPLELMRVDPSGRVERLSRPSADDVLGWLAAARPSGASLDELVAAEEINEVDTTVVVVTSPAGLPRRFGPAPVVAVVGRSSTWSKAEPEHSVTDVKARLPVGAELRFLAREEPLAPCLHG